ncbi:MAG: T9SS type A sorting domain-containing protein [Bacteroidia bacterium]
MGQTINIAIDENYEDWDIVSPAIEDGGDVINGIDLLNLKVINDKERLYLYFNLDSEVNLVNNIISQDLVLHIDTDNDHTTGEKIQSGYGIDLTIDFLKREAYYYGTNTTTIYFGDLDFVSAPTVSTFNIEFSINRNSTVNEQRIFKADSIKILLQENEFGDRLPNIGNVYTYGFKDLNQTEYSPIDFEKANEKLLRVTSYNVLLNSGWAGADKLKNLKSITKAINADVYAFQESRGTNANEAVDFLNNWLPITNRTWYAKKSGDLITCSKWPILETWTFERHLAVLIELPEVYNTNLLIINNHLSCCSNNEARQDQVDQFCDFLKDAKTEGGNVTIEKNTPIVYLGDFNLVGFKQQIETILEGDIQNTTKYGPTFLPDWDSTFLADAKPYHSDKNLVYTWRSLGNSKIYPPGRLDYQFYTDSKLQVDKSFVVNTAEMSANRLIKYNLIKDDSEATSDHLPVVVDYSIINTSTDVPLIKSGSSNFNLFPNPANHFINIISNTQIESIEVRDLTGKLVHRQNGSETKLFTSGLNNGVYILKIKAQGKFAYKRLVVNHI